VSAVVVWSSECGARRLRGGLVCSCPFHNMQLGFECIFSMRRGKLRDARHLILRGFILMHLISSHITNSHAPHITSFHQLSCTSYHEFSPTLIMRTLGGEGVFPFLLVFLIKRTPLKNNQRGIIFELFCRRNPAPPASWFGSHPTRKPPPPGGGVLTINLNEQKKKRKIEAER